MHGTSSTSSAQFTRLTFPDFSSVLRRFYDMYFRFCTFGIFCVFVFFLKSLPWAWCVLFRVHVFMFALYCICVFEQINDDDDDDDDTEACTGHFHMFTVNKQTWSIYVWLVAEYKLVSCHFKTLHCISNYNNTICFACPNLHLYHVGYSCRNECTVAQSVCTFSFYRLPTSSLRNNGISSQRLLLRMVLGWLA